MKEIKTCLVCSSGGHLDHLYAIKPLWENTDHFWATFAKEDSLSLLKDEKIYPVYFPSNRSIKALIINTVRAVKILRKERPDLIISSGAAPAVPFFYIGKMMGAKTVFIEAFDRFNKGSMTGKLCYRVSDVFIVQWEEMLKIYPKAVCLGCIF